MWGGFTFTKNALTFLNILYILVSFILISVAAYARVVSIVSNLAAVGGIIGCGAFLFILALLGLIGARKHHQVLLFFYMIILFILFIAQFSIAFACLSVSERHKLDIAIKGWTSANNQTKLEAQSFFNCCGFHQKPMASECLKVAPCCQSIDDCQCPDCEPKIVQAIAYGLNISGTIGLFFSFTEFIGVWLTIRYRNQKDPRADPNGFL